MRRPAQPLRNWVSADQASRVEIVLKQPPIRAGTTITLQKAALFEVPLIPIVGLIDALTPRAQLEAKRVAASACNAPHLEIHVPCAAPGFSTINPICD